MRKNKSLLVGCCLGARAINPLQVLLYVGPSQMCLPSLSVSHCQQLPKALQGSGRIKTDKGLCPTMASPRQLGGINRQIKPVDSFHRIQYCCHTSVMNVI